MNEKLLEQYKNIDWNKLLRKDLGSYNLEDAKTNLGRIKQIFDDILGYADINHFSQDYSASVEEQLSRWISFCDEIKNFGDTSEKQNFIDRIRQEETNIFNSLYQIISYTQIFDPRKDDQIKKITLVAQERVKQLSITLSKAEELSKIAKRKTVKDKVATSGEHFDNEAKKNQKNARLNFIFMIVSLFVTASISIFILGAISFDVSDNSFWSDLFNTINSQNILVKFVVISLGGYLIAHFSKVYSAEKHLYNINIQKQNALESHKRMLDLVIATESENEKEIRNAILLELTKAIFDAKDTGYLKTRAQTSSSPVSQVINKWTGSN